MAKPTHGYLRICLFVIIATVCAVASPAGAAGPYVNACDVVNIRGKLILRDFFENGVTPNIGAKSSPLLKLLKESQVLHAGVSAHLLAQKLQDLEQVHSQLPYYIFLALNHHQWFVVERKFEALPDSSPILDVPIARCHSLVAREESRVYFNKSTWNLLEPEQKVAAVLHQALLSLQKPELFSATSMPPETPVRELIAEIFKKNLRPLKIHDSITRYFQIPIRPFLDYDCSSSNFVQGSIHSFNSLNYAEPNSLSITVSADRNFNSSTLLNFEEHIQRPENKKDAVHEAVKNACTELRVSDGQISIEASRLPAKMSAQRLPIRYGVHYSLLIQPLHGILSFNGYDYATVDECISSVLKVVSNFIDGEDFIPSPGNDGVCY